MAALEARVAELEGENDALRRLLAAHSIQVGGRGACVGETCVAALPRNRHVIQGSRSGLPPCSPHAGACARWLCRPTPAWSPSAQL